jgi:hypothetical protein
MFVKSKFPPGCGSCPKLFCKGLASGSKFTKISHEDKNESFISAGSMQNAHRSNFLQIFGFCRADEFSLQPANPTMIAKAKDLASAPPFRGPIDPVAANIEKPRSSPMCPTRQQQRLANTSGVKKSPRLCELRARSDDLPSGGQYLVLLQPENGRPVSNRAGERMHARDCCAYHLPRVPPGKWVPSILDTASVRSGGASSESNSLTCLVAAFKSLLKVCA